MAETRVLPSGKVYRQIFDAQVQLSLAVYDARRKRASEERECSDAPDSASPQLNATHSISARNATYSNGKKSEEQDESEEVWGLPDTIVSEKKNSDIIGRLTEKRRQGHNEALSQLQTDLSSISEGLEPLFRQTGQDILLGLSEYNGNIERHMQKIENTSDLNSCNFQDMQEIWNKVCIETSSKRTLIGELNATYTKYESERKAMISALLKKFTTQLEKISYVMPCDVHRLIGSEAMMINQALLANRRALAKLHLNLMEKHLQIDIYQRQRWEEKLQDWKTMKLTDGINHFKNFMNSPQIQDPKNIQETLGILKSEQKTLSEKRFQTLEVLRSMIPPNISESSVAEWYSTLTSINEEIDNINVANIENLHKSYEKNWDVYLSEIDRFKTEMSTYGFTSEEIQNIVTTELLPLIGQSQSQTEVYLGKLDKAFESLAKSTATESKCLFKFMCGAAQLWETHCRGLLMREQQLQNSLEDISQVHDLHIQKKEAHLDMMLDKLRQESSEEALKTCLEKILTSLKEIKNGYMSIHKEEVETVECYPALVLQELQAYSLSLSQFFGVQEVYCQDYKQFSQLHPLLGQSVISIKNEKQKKESQEKQQDLPFLLSEIKETFTTSKGNVYHCFGWHTTQDEEREEKLEEIELVLYPKDFIEELLKEVRQTFFSHLEERFESLLSNTMNLVQAKKEKLKAELDLHLQLHQPRAARIEMDIHNVRAGELVHHRERVNRHCKGIQEVLEDSRRDSQDLQIQLNKLIEDFQMELFCREKDFTFSSSSEKLNKLWMILQKSQDKLVGVIQTSQRDFRQKIEFRTQGLRESNIKMIRSFKLFAEGGNFSPQELEIFQAQLEKIDKRIDTAEGTIIQDMEERESKCQEQAKDIYRKFEEKFSFHAIDLNFLEKMLQFFTNTRIQIKSEVLKSNMQKKEIDKTLNELKQIMAEFDQPVPNKKIATLEEISRFTTSLMDELKKRCQYLDAFLDTSMAVPPPDTPLQGAFVLAARSLSRTQECPSTPDGDGLLQPSRIGVSFLEDSALGVIKGLLKVGKAQNFKERDFDHAERHSSAARLHSPVGSGHRSGKGLSQSGLETLNRKSVESLTTQSSVSVRKFSKPNRFDKKFLIFGSKLEEQDRVDFKLSIRNIMWKANDNLLLLAEEFYKKKERRPITHSEHLQETFEQCAEEINRRLLTYQSTAHDYHNRCLQEFQSQLKVIEEFLSTVPQKLFLHLKDQHLEELNQQFTHIQQNFEKVQELSEQKKRQHVGQLHVGLSHPAFEPQLKLLIEAEEQRLVQQRHTVQSNTLELQACVWKNAEEFVTTLARLVEVLLFQFDNLITSYEVQAGYVEQKRENLTTLIRRTQTGFLQEDRNSDMGQKARTWSGICYFGFMDGILGMQPLGETATITTAKTTLAHLKTIEARNKIHELYGRRVQEELENIQRQCATRERELQKWQKLWQSQINSLTSLHSE